MIESEKLNSNQTEERERERDRRFLVREGERSEWETLRPGREYRGVALS